MPKMPDERTSITHRFTIDKLKVYMTVGLLPDGTVGEIFLRASQTGTTVRGLLNTLAMIVSMALQKGIPLATIVDKLKFTHYEPAGFTNNRSIPTATSITDYVGRWLEQKFLVGETNDGHGTD